MGSKSRTKGKSAELEVVHILREHGPWPDVERDLEQVRGTDNGRDIVNTEPTTIQVKRRKRITPAVIEAGLHEAEASKDHPTDYAACVHRSDHAPWRATMTVGDLTDMLGGGWTSFGEMTDALVEMDFVEWCRLVREVMR